MEYDDFAAEGSVGGTPIVARLITSRSTRGLERTHRRGEASP
jgi:hypothetical protein